MKYRSAISAAFLEFEPRTLPATITWIGGDGDWSVSSNWTTGEVPSSGDSVVIPSGTVTISRSLILDPLANLQVDSNAVINNVGALFVRGDVQLDGLMRIGDDSGKAGDFQLQGPSNRSISGSGAIEFGNSSLNRMRVADSSAAGGTTVVSVGANVTIRGNTGLMFGDFAFSGKIWAQTPNGRINLDGNWTNLGGRFAVENGGIVDFPGRVFNSNSILTLEGASGKFDMPVSTRISGGKIQMINGAEIVNPFDRSVFADLELAGTLRIAGTRPDFQGTVTVSGDVFIGDGENFGGLFADKILGSGTIHLNYSGPASINPVNAALIGTNLVVRGSGSVSGEIQGTILADVPGRSILVTPNSATFSNGVLNSGTYIVGPNSSIALPDIVQNKASIQLQGPGSKITRAILPNQNNFNLPTINSGLIQIGPGAVLPFSRGFQQDSNGTLRIQIAGAPQTGSFGRVQSSSSVNLGGKLSIERVDGFAAGENQIFPVISASDIEGNFSTIEGLVGATGLPFTTQKVANEFRLTTVSGENGGDGGAGSQVVAPGIPPKRFTVAADVGGGPIVSLHDETGKALFTVSAYDASFTGGVRVATLDANRDGSPDLATAPGVGIAPLIRVFNSTDGTVLREFFAFEETFTGGVFLAAADLNGDGVAEILISPDTGGGPRVRILDGVTNDTLADFFGIEDPNFRGGARLGIGDVSGDGVPDVLVGAGIGGGPRVAIFDGKSLRPGSTPVKLVSDFFLFEPTLRNGVYLTSGDVNGDSVSDILASGGPGGGPRVFGIDGKSFIASGGSTLNQVANFFAGDPNSRGGVRITAKDLDGDAFADIVTAPGRGSGPLVSSYRGAGMPSDGTPTLLEQFNAFDGSFFGGVFVG